MKTWKSYSWLPLLLLAGCASLKPTVVARAADLVVYPHFAPVAQSVVDQLSLSSIATLDIIPYVLASGSYYPISSITGNPTTVGAADMTVIRQFSPFIDPSRPFIFRGLKPNNNYHIVGHAYNSSNALISKDANSYVDVAVGNNDAPSLAQLPICLNTVPFAASVSVAVQVDGRYEYLKGTLYALPGNAQVATDRTTRYNPDFTFSNLQGNSNYRLVVEAYKLGALLASTSLDFNISNETAPAPLSMSLTVPYVVTTWAGDGTSGYADGVNTSARFAYPFGLAEDSSGNLYVGDRNNQRIRKITPTGTVSTVAGDGTAAILDGPALAARFVYPEGMFVDPQGTIYISNNNSIRKLSGGTVTTLAGADVAGYVDVAGANARFCAPEGMTMDSSGNLYVADQSNHAIRKVAPDGTVSTFAGNGTAGLVDGTGPSARFNKPRDIKIDAQGYFYVADYSNNCIRKIAPNGAVTTFVGNGTAGTVDGTGGAARFTGPIGLAVDEHGNLLVADHNLSFFRKVSMSGVVKTLAGCSPGYVNGTGTAARFNGPLGIAVDPNGKFYVTDYYDNVIRMFQ